jgi:hypothetical protein
VPFLSSDDSITTTDGPLDARIEFRTTTGAVWGSPIDRLTLIGAAPRDMFGNFAPSAAAMVRLLGTPNDGFVLSALGKFKVEGFATGPNNEMESEIEAASSSRTSSTGGTWT